MAERSADFRPQPSPRAKYRAAPSRSTACPRFYGLKSAVLRPSVTGCPNKTSGADLILREVPTGCGSHLPFSRISYFSRALFLVVSVSDATNDAFSLSPLCEERAGVRGGCPRPPTGVLVSVRFAQFPIATSRLNSIQKSVLLARRSCCRKFRRSMAPC